MVLAIFNCGVPMKLILSFLAFLSLVSCGKKIEEESTSEVKRSTKEHLSSAETWSIFSERPLPAKVMVLINEMEFFNECTNLGNGKVERTYKNGTINIVSYAAFRQEYFDVDIYDCQTGSTFYSEDYVDQTLIDHPKGAPIKVVLRLRN